jgi:hypothetical protein
MQTTTHYPTGFATQQMATSDRETMQRIDQLFDRMFCDDGECIIEVEQALRWKDTES